MSYINITQRQGPPPPGNGNNIPCENICNNASPNSSAYKRCDCDSFIADIVSIDDYTTYTLAMVFILALIYVWRGYMKHRQNLI